MKMFFGKTVHRFSRLRNSRGQVAIIILLIIAFTLVVYAVGLNLGKISGPKTSVTMASNSAASLLASQMASYGQKIYKETMGGKFKICSTNWLGILAFLIALVVVIWTFGAGAAALGAMAGAVQTMAVLGLVLSTVSLVLNVTVIQPGLTKMWNKITQNLDIKDQFLENGLQTALFRVVDDPIQVPDVYDNAGDTVFGQTGGQWNDYVSRLGYYYDRRLKDDLKIKDPKFVEDFLFELRKLVYGSTVSGKEYNCEAWMRMDGTVYSCGDCDLDLPGCETEGSPGSPGCTCDGVDRCSTTVPHGATTQLCQLGPTEQVRCYSRPDPLAACGAAHTPLPDDRVFALTDEASKTNECTYIADLQTALNSFCNPCCLPFRSHNLYYDPTLPQCDPASEFFDPMEKSCMEFVRLTPEGCDCVERGKCEDKADELGITSSCWHEELNPYVTGSPVNAFIYDRNYQNTKNNFKSFLEGLGQDDGHPNYYSSRKPVGTLAQTYAGDGNAFWTVDDADGIFPLVHYLAKWGINLNTLNPEESVANLTGEHCYWYDPTREMICQPTEFFARDVYDQPLVFPLDPLTLRYQENHFVDGSDQNTSGRPPVGVDKILNFNDLEAEGLLSIKLGADEDACAHQDQSTGYWKSGADRYCSLGDSPPGWESYYPYNTDCPKNYRSGGPPSDSSEGNCLEDGTIPRDCECSEVGADKKRLWRDDAVDEIGMQIRNFIDLAKELLLNESNIRGLVNNFESWYIDIFPWIETTSVPGGFVPGVNCYYCGVYDGENLEAAGKPVHVLQKMVNRMHVLVTAFEEYQKADFSDAGAWCVPPASDCPACLDTSGCDSIACGVDAPAAERLTFGDPALGVHGRLEDVEACLRYNADGYNYYTEQLHPLRMAMGNDYRYSRCGKTCSLLDCSELPRSLIPLTSYDRKLMEDSYIVPAGRDPEQDFVHSTLFNTCLDRCSASACQPVSRGGNLPDGFGYAYPDEESDPFVPDAHCAPGVDSGGTISSSILKEGTSWYDAVVANQELIAVAYPIDQDVKRFLDCVDTCTPEACLPQSLGGALPDTPTDPAATYTYSYPAGGFNAATCSGGAGGEWYDAVTANMALANPSCDLTQGNPWTFSVPEGELQVNLLADLAMSEDPATGWLFKTRHSALEAKNQVVKFRQRRNFLAKVISGLNGAIMTLRTGRDKIAEFLNGPAALLVQERKKLTEHVSALSKNIIYGWQSEPPESRKNLPEGDPLKDQGYWHIVKVEAGFPQNCIGDCGWGDNPAALWPKVVTYTKNLGLTRCYEIKHRTGLIKVRVIRWDEDKDKSSLTFPNKIPIWNSRSHHPDKSSLQEMKDPEWMHSKCPPLNDYENKNVTGIYRGAFMTDSRDNNRNCWTVANDILAHGVMTETCAVYYGRNSARGFTFEFIKCPDGW